MSKDDSFQSRSNGQGILDTAGRLLIRFIEFIGLSFIAVFEAAIVIIVFIGVGLIAIILFRSAVAALATLMGSN